MSAKNLFCCCAGLRGARSAALTAAILVCGSVAGAQPEAEQTTRVTPELGPSKQASPPDATPAQQAGPHAGNPQRALQPGTSGGQAQPSADVPKGTVRVTVRDSLGATLAGVEVELGIMKQEGNERDRQKAETGADGVAVFADLPTGSTQAYRVNVYNEGAKFSTNPFRLPPDKGVAATLERRGTIQESRAVFVLMHWILLELKGNRMHVSEQLQFVNLSHEQYVFPGQGKRLRLPDGALAFQAQKTMGDQRVTFLPDEGVYLAGSLPPGRTDLTWAFDLPITGEDLSFTLPTAFRTMQLRVDADAPKGLELRVEGLPDAQFGYHRGRRIASANIQRRPGDENALSPVKISVFGIPSASGANAKWFAFGGAVLVLLVAMMWGFRSEAGDGIRALSAAKRQRDRAAILAELEELETDFKENEVGPQYRKKRRQELTDSLALVLRDEATAKASAAAAATERRGPGAPSKESVEWSFREAQRQLLVGVVATLLFTAAFPFLGVFFVGAFRRARDARRDAKGPERKKLNNLFAAATAACAVWAAGLVGGAIWLSTKLI